MAELTELVQRGWAVLRLTAGSLTADIVPALGGTVLALRHGDTDLLWSTPWGLRHRGSLVAPGNSQALMLDGYPGGWHPLFPNGSGTAIVDGAELGYDGEARLTWLDWTWSDGELTLTGRLARYPFAIRRTFRLDEDGLHLTEKLTNQGGELMEAIWGQQIVFGPSLVGPGAVLDTSATTIHPDPTIAQQANYDDITPWPRAHGANGMINLRRLPAGASGEKRSAFLSDFGAGSSGEPEPAWIAVQNRDAGLAVRLEWDGDAWPHLWYELEAGGGTGYPWYSRGYFLGLAPASSWPSRGLHDARRISATTIRFFSDESRTATLGLTVRTLQ